MVFCSWPMNALQASLQGIWDGAMGVWGVCQSGILPQCARQRDW
jgi:hypothetical protein